MTHRSVLVVMGMTISLVSSAIARPAGAIIDFETVPGVGVPTEGTSISNQYQASDGVSFSLEGGGFPVIAEAGSPRTAFAGYPSGAGDDTPAPGQGVGTFFLTDDGVVEGIPQALIISYDSPVAAASGVIIDIDGDEAWDVEARNSSGVVIDTVSLSSGDPDTGDGIATPWSFSHPFADIDSLRIVYVGEQNIVGLAFDNFSPTGNAVPSMGIEGLVGITVGLLVISALSMSARRRA